MGKVLTHESLAAGAWNRDHCSATSTSTAWQTELTNTAEVLQLTLDRMSSDYSQTTPRLRKAFGLKEVEPLLMESAKFFVVEW